MLLRNDHDEERGPIAQDTEEIGQDLGEMLATCYSSNGIHDKAQEGPEKSRDHRERTSEGLNRQPSGIRVWNVISAVEAPLAGYRVTCELHIHHRESKQDQDELASPIPGRKNLRE